MEKISINKITEGKTKGGKTPGSTYFLVETNKGKMSVFDSALFKDISDLVGKEVEVEITTSGNFKNITDIGDVIGNAVPEKVEKESERFGRDPVTITRTECHRMAVDLCVAGKIELEHIIDKAEGFYTSIVKVKE